MSLWDKVLSPFRGKENVDLKIGLPDEMMNALGVQITSNELLTKEKQYRYIPLIAACAIKNAETVASQPWRFHGWDDDTEIYDDIYLNVLQNPNTMLDNYTFKYLTQLYLEFFGKAVWFKSVDKTGTPIGLDLLDHRRLSEVIVNGVVTYYKYVREDSVVVELAIDEVIPFINPKPFQHLLGNSVLEPLQLSSSIFYESKVFQKEYFDNKALPSSVVELDDKTTWNETHVKQMQDNWNTNHGKGKRHKLGVVKGHIVQIPIDLASLALDQLNKSVVDEILVSFGVSKTILGLSDNVNRATSEQARMNYMEFTIQPRLDRLDAVLNNRYLNQATYARMYSKHKSVVVRYTPDEVIKMIQFGLVSQNEGRIELGYEPVVNDEMNKQVYRGPGSVTVSNNPSGG
jgi:HK97 family phage portal protein